MAEAGRRGTEIRSDCWVKVDPGGSGVRIDLRSKVESMYGESIRRQIASVLGQLGVTNAGVEVVDSGALPFTIAARVEAAVRRAGVPVRAPALPEGHPAAARAPHHDRPRRSRLYLPGVEPKFMVNAGLHGPDGVILDLEDSVPPGEKDTARIVVRNALIAVDFAGAERMVRINQLPAGLEDLEWVMAGGPEVIVIPKCESAEEVRAVDERVRSLEATHPALLMPIIETALGCFRAREIAEASPHVAALTIGLEDYTADIGAQRTAEGRESFWARSMIVNAARAAGVQPIDSVFSDVEDMEALARSALEAKGLGFEGKGCIHPRQIPVIHEAFNPTPEEIEKAERIVAAFEEARAKGSAVVALGSKMIDPPVVKRAQRTLDLARRCSLLDSSGADQGRNP